MYKNGFIKVGSISPKLEVGNPLFNIKEIIRLSNEAKSSITVFPELCITGYTCADYFYQQSLLDNVYTALELFLEQNKNEGIVILGAPLINELSLYNCAVVIQKNHILGVVPKMYLPNSDEFYEKRWFKSGLNSNINEIFINGVKYPFGNIIFTSNDNQLHFGVELCEDMWAPITRGNILSLYGANLICNLSASNEFLGKSENRRLTVCDNSRRNLGAYIYTSAGASESTSDTVFAGHNIIASLGNILNESEDFNLDSEVIYADIDIAGINYKRLKGTNFHYEVSSKIDVLNVTFDLKNTKFDFEKEQDQTPFVPKNNEYKDFKKISNILELSLCKRLIHTNMKTVVLGVSGGLDSTLALLVCVKVFEKLNLDLKNIIAVTMPGLGTSSRTKNNAFSMMESLGVTVLCKPINDSVIEHFKLIEHDIELKDVTYENAQARIRTLILMNLANKYNGLVIGTGDMSELALGWCTYNGDQMSMYSLNGGVPKTLVKFMIKEYALNDFKDIKDTLFDVIDTPISPELLGTDQKTEDSIGKYEVNDYILYRYLNFGDSKKRLIYLLGITFKFSDEVSKAYVDKFFFRFFTQQFKRQALPDGPKVLNVSLAPRSDYKMPSDLKGWNNE